MWGCPHDLQSVNLQKLLGGILQQCLFPSGDHPQPDAIDVLDGRLQSDDVAHRRRARLELVGQFVVGGVGESDGLDHLAAALVRRHLIEPLFFPIQHAHSHGGVHFVSREAVEVAVEGLHINRKMPGRLRAIHQHGDAFRMGFPDDLRHRVDGAEGVGDVVDGHETGLFVQQTVQFLHAQHASVVEGQHSEGGAMPFAG